MDLRRPIKLFAMSRLGRIRVYLTALWKLARHPQTPKPAKWVAGAVLAYALSPVDLIPDFVPVLGLLDDVVIVPLGVALAIRLTPRPLWEQMLREAEAAPLTLPKVWSGAVLIVLIWVALLALLVWAGWRFAGGL